MNDLELLNQGHFFAEMNKTSALKSGQNTNKQRKNKIFLNHRSDCSQREFANKLFTSKSYVQKNLKQSSNIRPYKNLKISYRNA